MSLHALVAALVGRGTLIVSSVLLVALGLCQPVQAQLISTTRAVGGISIDTNGLLEPTAVDSGGRLRKQRMKVMQQIPDDLNGLTSIRKISLRRLDAAIQRCLDSGEDLPDNIRYLAGMQRIQYVFVVPEQNDVILAGPGEGWTVDKQGFVVGVTTGRPVLLLDDLLVALRSARQNSRQVISCSIDPTAEGLQRLREHVAGLRTIGNPQQTAAGVERTLGKQQISISGVPATSHFARVLVAADYRMKRLAMNFEPSPVKGLPSYLAMIKPGPRGMSNMMPRWWLAPDFAPLLRDAEGTSWELQRASVKAMAEEDFLTASGDRKQGGKANPVAQRWADNMTAKYDELALADPIFGQLRNCIDLAVVATLIVKEDMLRKAGCRLSAMTDSSGAEIVSFPAPQEVDSKASLLKKGRNWLISASGGVKVDPRLVVGRVEKTDSLDATRVRALAREHEEWWWN
ncbi:MAG: DUF1598 domain-containing protein [Candidatus Nealsonbacteria bacterium]|nr:DUF1598 domain-containing protein [Candidatus Nealsonbacteria bacterium]